MTKPVTIALVGIGGYGDVYLEALLAASPGQGVQMVAAIDPEPARSQRLHEIHDRGIPLFADLDAFYATSSADLVIISAPIHFHCPLTLLALAHGSHVLCEKPLAATVQEAILMAEAEKKAGKFVAVGYQWSFSTAIHALKRDIMAGDFGRPLRLKALVFWPRMRSYYTRSPWAGAITSNDGRWVLDSPVNNATAHYLHNMLYILGSTRETAARPLEMLAELYRANTIENYDTAALRCQTENGEVLFYASHAVPAVMGPVFHYEFENAVIYHDLDNPGHIMARSRDGHVRKYDDANVGLLNKLWQSVESVRTGAPPVCGIRACLPHTLCVNGAQDSMPDITAFPADRIQTDDNAAKDRLTWVTGLQGSLVQCYDQGILPSEHGAIDWAREGKTVNLRDYRSFPGGTPV